MSENICVDVNTPTKYSVGDVFYGIALKNIRKFKVVAYNTSCQFYSVANEEGHSLPFTFSENEMFDSPEDVSNSILERYKESIKPVIPESKFDVDDEFYIYYSMPDVIAKIVITEKKYHTYNNEWYYRYEYMMDNSLNLTKNNYRDELSLCKLRVKVATYKD